VLVDESVPRILHLQCTLHSCSHGRVELKVGALNAGGEEACGDESCDRFNKLVRLVTCNI
jgi:hypothetical protein